MPQMNGTAHYSRTAGAIQILWLDPGAAEETRVLLALTAVRLSKPFTGSNREADIVS